MQSNGTRSGAGNTGGSEEIIRISRWVYPAAILAFLLLLFLIWLVFIDKSDAADQYVFGELRPAISPSGVRWMKAVSFLGTHRFLIPANLVLIFYLLVQKKQRAAMAVTVVALSSWGLMSLLKNGFQRHRPDLPLVEGITNYSFPSGHAMMSVAYFGLLMGMAGHYFPGKRMQWVFILSLFALVMLIGFSRVYLRVHYTTDVLAGYCTGLVWLYLSIWTVRYFQSKKGLGGNGHA